MCCLLFVVCLWRVYGVGGCCVEFVVCSLFVIYRVLFVCCCLVLFGVSGVLFMVVCCSLFVVVSFCTGFVDSCFLCPSCSLLCVVRRSLLVVCLCCVF